MRHSKKTPIIRNSILAASVFFWTLLLLSVGYAAYSTLAVNSWDPLSTAKWNELVSYAVPPGAVMTFNLASCPTGWSAFSQANGRTVIWVGNDGQWNTYSLLNSWGEARHTLTTAEMPSHAHGFSIGTTDDNNSPWNVALLQLGDNGPFSYANFTTATTGGGSSHENRMPYVALLYCVKN